jgi:TrmH family RNA methyltransferase
VRPSEVPPAPTRGLIEQFHRARHDRSRAVLEGFHAIKHAIRFNAAIEQVCAADPDALWALTRQLAPDVEPELARLVRLVPQSVFAQLAPAPPETGIIAIARRPEADVPAILEPRSGAPIVLLEAPAHLGNGGCVVGGAAAAGAAAILTTGPQDPWHPAALRGSAGLHFALPIAWLDRLPAHRDRPLIAIHPEEEPLCPGALPDRAIMTFGSERRGLSRELLGAADRQIAIPMRLGVSSLNLASAVAIILYTWRLTSGATST